MPSIFKHMKQKLEGQFGDEIIITHLNGKPDVTTLHIVMPQLSCSTAARKPDVTTLHIVMPQLSCSTAARNKDSKFEIMHTIQTAAKLIRSDVKSMDTSCESYPSRELMADAEAALKYIPEILQELLRVCL